MKNLNLILCICLLCFTNITMAQEKNKTISFILVVDGEVLNANVSITFLIGSENSDDKIFATYYPGTLSMSQADYEKLISDHTKSFYLKYYQNNYVNGKLNYCDFVIEYNKIWLQDTYNILRLYNLEKGKYKNKIEPLSKTKNYTFEVESSNGQMLRVRKS
ncbi:MAG TPA: hypothetical protein VFS71_04685 [Flavobacterium sp.]|uniref:hypothetical protein n=1 Tax=Flavobacterium sp. TaxID=239 RepID=UPI002DB72E6A|nr:hypothetical protein [Flavobacterium sp.]HEU4788960.1 hypothetical protein [Flavobacterium sp.]